MDLKTLKDTPPWDWPADAGKMFLEILSDDQVDEPDRLLAAELAGHFTVINDELFSAVLSIVRNGEEPEKSSEDYVRNWGRMTYLSVSPVGIRNSYVCQGNQIEWLARYVINKLTGILSAFKTVSNNFKV